MSGSARAGEMLNKLKFLLDSRLPKNELDNKLQEEYTQASADMKKEFSEWLRYRVLYLAANEVLENNPDAKTATENECFANISKRINESELEDCCHHLTLPRTNVMNDMEDEGYRDTKIFTKYVEDFLKTSLEEITFYYNGLLDVNEAPIPCSKLAEMLADEKKKKHKYLNQIKGLRKTEKQLYAVYMQELLATSSALSIILTKYRMELQPRKDKERFKNLLAKIETLDVKVKSLILKLKNERYTKQHVEALEAIRSELVERTAHLKKELIAVQQQLNEFKVLGEDFHEMVLEYSHLQTEIKKQLWYLQKLDQ